jgi:uncharacterized membrane protein
MSRIILQELRLGPVDMVMIQLDNKELNGAIADEIIKASDKNVIRVLDALAVKKEDDGSFSTLEATDLTKAQHKEMGAVIGTFLGLGAGGEEGAEEGAKRGAERFAKNTFGLSKSDVRSIAQQVPAGKTLLMILFEHRWALKLKEAADRANGVVLAEGIIRPETLVMAGASLAS